MKFQKTMLASATTAALAAAGSAQAINLGEFQAADQIGGVLHIFDQADLNDPTVDAVAAEFDMTQPATEFADAHQSNRMHILGFSNHAGVDPASRTIMTYLNGWASVYNTNAGTGNPVEVAELEASTANAYAEEGLAAPQRAGSLHACGGNPQNDQIQCASIFNADFSLFSADMVNNTYNRIGIYTTGDLTISPKLKGKTKQLVTAAYDELVANDGDGQPNNICSQYSTDGSLLYLAVQNNFIEGGVIVVDVSDPTNPTVLDAYNDVMAAGCGLVNNPDGEHLWITHGFNRQGDPESVSIWAYSRAGKKSGPVANIYLSTDDAETVVLSDGTSYGGDAHGAQYAGITSGFFWQTMRIDDTIEVLSNEGGDGAVVNEIDLIAGTGRDIVSPDVIDRSQLGGHMYYTTRGQAPTSAITAYKNKNRKSGVDVWSTVFGYDGAFVKHEDMSTGVAQYMCGDGGASGAAYDSVCAAGDAGAVAGDTTDPHGGKSLNYLTGF